MDFYKIEVVHKSSNNRHADIQIKPVFLYGDVKDLICRGGDFYAFWNNGQWDFNRNNLRKHIDNDVWKKYEEIKEKYPESIVTPMQMIEDTSGIMKRFIEYCRNSEQFEGSFNKKILFADDVMKREDYATTKLPYSPKKGPTPAFDEMFNKLYSPKELEKILWFLGAVFTNSMVNIEKFLFLYGSKGSGKGTMIHLIRLLFDGYHAPIDLEHLTSDSEFATTGVQEIPLLIDDDTNLMNIRKDTNLLKLTSHDLIPINEKYKKTYNVRFNGLLVAASNQRYKVRNIDSGITRRAVVVEPTKERHTYEDYHRLRKQLEFELPQIAQRAIDTFNKHGAGYLNNYVNLEMIEYTDPVFAFVKQSRAALGDTVSLKKASELYLLFLTDLGFNTEGYKRIIRNELGRYYKRFHADTTIDGVRYKNVFSGFKSELFEDSDTTEESKSDLTELMDEMNIRTQDSYLDKVGALYPAQKATESGIPSVKWDNCTTVLEDLDTSELHFVRLPMNHIVIDFDKKNDEGEKDLYLNLMGARNFPPTYMELSKSGQGVHLHYYYDGDVSKLEKLYEDDIEIKVFTGKSSLRRKLTMCNDMEITSITSGLPEKKGKVKMYEDIKLIPWDERRMRRLIEGNLKKKYHANTKPSVDFIHKIFKEAYEAGVKYDLENLKQDVYVFAASSTNQATECLRLVEDMVFSTIDNDKDMIDIQSDGKIVPDEDLWFMDLEVFPNLFIVGFKKYGDDTKHILINPTASELEPYISKPFIGFNNRRYDNHILYAAAFMDYTVKDLYIQSQRIIGKEGAGAFFKGAYELSYADIYEYLSPVNKSSLKAFQIKLGIKHDELELPWDQPVPEHMFERVAEYMWNDITSTEEVFKATYSDYKARLVMTELSGLSVNAKTQDHAAKILFGDDPNPQDKFIYTNLADEFPGYEYSFGKSTYLGENPSEGGYVYSEPGIYEDVALFDVESMHPWSLIALNYFGPYTQNFKDLVVTRMNIKHKDFDAARELYNGRLKKYLDDVNEAKDLSNALKGVINIVYGMTSAKFPNKFKHPDNHDNIVAKRGALFIMTLKKEVQERGYQVVHVKTDSIKVVGATQELKDFIWEFAAKYGYSFDHEKTFGVMGLINKSTYAGWYEVDGEIRWETIGTQFIEPIVRKRLFTKEEVVETDYFLRKNAKVPIYIGERFVGKFAEVYASKTGSELMRVDGDKRSYVTGTKGYLWKLSSEYSGYEDLDMVYYDGLVESAREELERVDESGLIGGLLINYEE